MVASAEKGGAAGWPGVPANVRGQRGARRRAGAVRGWWFTRRVRRRGPDKPASGDGPCQVLVLGRVRRVRWAGAGRVGSRKRRGLRVALVYPGVKQWSEGGRGVLPRGKAASAGGVGGDGVPVVVAGQQVEGGVRERGWDVLTALRRVLGFSRAAPGGYPGVREEWRAGGRDPGQGAVW